MEKLELNKQKIREIKDVLGLTWKDIADRGGLKNRQTAYEKYNCGSILQANFFAKIFGIKAKDLIK